LGSAVFAENMLMFLKFGIKFFNLLKRGGKIKKTGDSTMFYFRLYVFPEILMHIKEIFLGERKNK